MGHVGYEILTHLIDLDLFLDVLLQLRVGRSQLTDGLLQRIGQTVHAVPQHTNLILRLACVFGIEIQIGHLLRQIRKLENRGGDLFRGKVDKHTSHKQRRDSHVCQETVGQIHALPDTGQRRRHQKDGRII